jgi:hypothetical protein
MDEDELMNLVRTFQYEDWTDRRFLEVTSEGYRRGVAGLARRLVAASRAAEAAGAAEVALVLGDAAVSEEDDSPGFIDRVAGIEDALPKSTQALAAIALEVGEVGRIMQEATSEIRQGGKAGRSIFTHRLIVARQMATQLSEHVERILTLANENKLQFSNLDDGFRAIIERAPAEIKSSPEARAQVCQFFAMVRGLSQKVHESSIPAQELSGVIAGIEKMSRDLRPVLRRLRQGLSILGEAKEVTQSWVNLIDASGVDCVSLVD